MNYPITYERYHVVPSNSTQPIVCHNLPIALQYIASLPSGSMVRIEKVVETHVIYSVYGVADNPMPTKPVVEIPTVHVSIQHVMPT